MSRNQSIALAAIAIVASVTGVLLARALLLDAAAPPLALASGTLLTPPRPLPPVALTDHEGKEFGLDRLRGRWSLLFFGFTNCPDVCPTTLGMLAQVEKRLADLRTQPPQVVLVSVDPERDAPEQLSKYVKFFSPSFVGATGSQATINEFTRQMHVPVVITPLGGGGYTVDHSASMFAINPQGELRALFSPPHSPDAIAGDLRRLIEAHDG